MELVVERLAQSPRLPWVVEELASLYEKEKRLRQHFYDTIEDGQKIEFINGKIIMHSPDTLRHVEIRKRVTKLLDTHSVTHNLGIVGDEKLLICLTRNDYMPDVVFFAGQKGANLRPEQLKFPAPDLAVEVLSKSTKRRDRGVKFEDYAAHGVEEYWIIDPEARSVEIFRLDSRGRYTLLQKGSNDTEMRSLALPGFKCPVAAFFDDSANLATLKKLLK